MSSWAASSSSESNDWAYARSEEHTSELQSRQYLVCRLLLEKKKNNQRNQNKEIDYDPTDQPQTPSDHFQRENHSTTSAGPLTINLECYLQLYDASVATSV